MIRWSIFVVWRLGALNCCGLGGADVHTPVHLTAVHAYDLDRETAHQGETQGSLAYPCGADDG